jgi:hypothetical protein
VRQNAAFGLAYILDPRAAAVALHQMSSRDPKTQLLGMISVSLATNCPLTAATRDALRLRLSQILTTAPAVETRLVARAALLELEDARGCDGLWSDLAREESLGHPTYRWYPVRALASWRPVGFDSEQLRVLLHDDDPAMRCSACLVAGQAKALTLRRELNSLTDDSATFGDEPVGKFASEALDRIMGRRPPWEPHPKAQRPSHARPV